MKNKLLIGALFLICGLCIPLFTACGEPESYNVQLNYSTDYGNLSFEEIVVPSGEYYTFCSSHTPIITNEGDERIFSHWIDDNGNVFEYDVTQIQVNSDIEINLKAVFDEAEVVYKACWEENDALHSNFLTKKYPSIAVNSLSEINGDFVKIKKSENNNYITEKDFALLDNACFKTSSNGETKFVTYDDVTTDTYQLNYSLKINNNYYIVKTYGIKNKMPKFNQTLSFLKNILGQFFDCKYIEVYDEGVYKIQVYDNYESPYLTNEEIANLPGEFAGFDYSKNYVGVYYCCDYVVFKGNSAFYEDGDYGYIGAGVDKEALNITRDQASEYLAYNF